MIRDREVVAYAAFWWISIVAFFLLGMRLRSSVLLVAALIAVPISIALAIATKRFDEKQSRRREQLRAENRFSEAAERHADSVYVAGIVWGGSYLAIGVFLLIGSLVIGNPLGVAGALLMGGLGARRVLDYRRWWREEREHRSTSAERIASAAEGLAEGNWERQQPPSQ